jgi:hypothetical protein
LVKSKSSAGSINLIPAAAGFIVLCLLATIYLLPSVIAFARGRHQNGASVFVVNLFLGWTLLGWVISMASAVSAVRERQA